MEDHSMDRNYILYILYIADDPSKIKINKKKLILNVLKIKSMKL
jgi:hypothetical protein